MTLGLPTMFRPGRHPGGGLVSFIRSERATSSIPYFLPEAQPILEIPIPYGSFVEWATWTAFLTGTTPYVARLDSDADDWKDWGRGFLSTEQMQGYQIPHPDEFDDWFSWASEVRRAFTGA